MSLNASQLGQDMLGAFKGVLNKKWPDIQEYAQAEANKLAQALVMIETLKLSGKINESQARLHLEIQKNSTRTVFLTLEGLGILVVEEAVNSALAVVKEAVNSALGFALV